MQIDWTTFGLEILNFFVLVWTLQHFFYRPVLAVLDKRRTAVGAASAEAARAKQEAEALKTQYEQRAADWQKERDRMRAELEDELAKEREKRLAALNKALADDAEARRARANAQSAAHEEALLRQAAASAFGDAAAMLRRMAAPELTAMIARVFIADLAVLPPDRREALRRAGGDAASIVSAHPLDAKTKAALAAALSQAAGRDITPAYKESAELIAGLRVALGAYTLSADLADELAFFQRDRHG